MGFLLLGGVSFVLFLSIWYFKYYIYDSLNFNLKKHKKPPTLVCKGKFLEKYKQQAL